MPSHLYRDVRIMGILNVTPDSFSDGGAFLDPDRAVQHACTMLDEGADIIDVGGESTRPPGAAYGAGASRITAEEELNRVIPVIEQLLVERPKAIVSIDTSKSEVAQRALTSGAQIVNDVSAGTNDDAMFHVVARHHASVILMHGYGPPFSRPRIEDYAYADVVKEVQEFLSVRVHAARAAGIEQVYADVGIGFAKVYDDNMALLKHHADFLSLGVPLVIGVSRKSSIGRSLGRDSVPSERVAGSLAAALWAVEQGATVIRTHDVQATRDALNVLTRIQSA